MGEPAIVQETDPRLNVNLNAHELAESRDPVGKLLLDPVQSRDHSVKT